MFVRGRAIKSIRQEQRHQQALRDDYDKTFGGAYNRMHEGNFFFSVIVILSTVVSCLLFCLYHNSDSDESNLPPREAY